MTLHAGEIIRGIITLALIAGAVGFVVVRSVKRAEDPVRTVFKWLITVGVGLFIIRVAIPAVMVEGYAAHYKLKLGKEELRKQALAWAMGRGNRSGRVAWQFIQEIAGELGQKI